MNSMAAGPGRRMISEDEARSRLSRRIRTASEDEVRAREAAGPPPPARRPRSAVPGLLARLLARLRARS